MHRLTGKTCIITGAARGIGHAIAQQFVLEGATVVVTDKRQREGLAVADSLGATFIFLDVADEKHWETLQGMYPKIDVLVNNAGVTGFEESMNPQDPEHASLEDWNAVHAVNLDGVFLGCRYAIGAMRNAGGGSIINISSRSAMIGIPQAAAYASSKAAIRNHTKTVALYCAQQGLNIRCNSIHPAAILTPMWDPMLKDAENREERAAQFVQDIPLQRFGKPEEVAAVAVMLASDEATYMTGTELNIDGGILAGSSVSPGR